MTPREINISYGITGDITLMVTWHPASIDDALANIGDFIARLKGDQPKAEPKPVKPVVEPKPAKTKPKQTVRGKHMWTDDEKQECAQRYAAGEDLEVLARDYSSTPLSIQKIVQKLGVKRPWPTKGNPSQLKPEQEEPKEEPV